MLRKLRRDVKEKLVSTAALRSAIFLKVRRFCIINMGKKYWCGTLGKKNQ